MKYINLASLQNAYQSLSDVELKRYLNYFNIQINHNELEDLSHLVEILISEGVNDLNNFFVGYKINQISKEFDLLRFGENEIINIEIKRSSTEEKIKKQLEKNRYYLDVLNKDIYTYTFVVEDLELFQFNCDNNLNRIYFNDLIESLNLQVLIEVDNIDVYFNPSNYLVSPFNSTESFINDNYFLTDHQQSFRRDILSNFNNRTEKFAAIVGNPGTGKTLLTYDIARHYIDMEEKVLIIHCGILNEGHYKLRTEYGWNVVGIRNYYSNILQEFDLIIIDEVQRIKKEQMDNIVQAVEDFNAKCIFSYDPRQCFSYSEYARGIPKYIESVLESKTYKLTDKIRSNKEIASFITTLYDLSKTNRNHSYDNIKLQYFVHPKTAKEFMDSLTKQGWEVLNYTTSMYYVTSYDHYQNESNKNAHKVIGQEFDKVVAIIDENFYYDSDKKLNSRRVNGAPDYDLDKMLYQNLTRARQQLTIVIINNNEILNSCLEILGVETELKKQPT